MMDVVMKIGPVVPRMNYISGVHGLNLYNFGGPGSLKSVKLYLEKFVQPTSLYTCSGQVMAHTHTQIHTHTHTHTHINTLTQTLTYNKYTHSHIKKIT